MMRTLIRLGSSLVVLGVLAPTWAGAQEPKPVAATEARPPELEQAGFRVPPGFAIELVASEPSIGKPMNLAFDARGRLWVTSTVEYPFPAAEGTTPRDRALILSDFAPDGKARKVETFADGLNIPIGVLPLGAGDTALIHSIPRIRRYADTNSDGRADRIDPAYHEFGSRDTHGMTNAFTRGFDGWIYACHGFSNTSTVQGSDGKPITMNSGNIYRFQPDGSHAEYYSHGQVNPFGLAFDPMGRLYSCDCHSRPIYQNIRGAYYPSFGAADDGLGFGPEMIHHDHGSTGIGGIAYYDADHFPPEYRASIYLGNVVTGRVHRDTLDWQGSSPRAVTQPDLVISDDPWFHPVDVKLGPDGALYIADFYNRIIGHYEVPLDHPGRDRERGRIWRVVYKGIDGTNPTPADPRPNAPEATVAQLVADLAHPNMVVRMRAADLLVERGKGAVEAPLKAALAEANDSLHVHGLWVLERLGVLEDARVLAASQHASLIVRVHAARIWGDRGEIGTSAAALQGLGLQPLPRPAIDDMKRLMGAYGANPVALVPLNQPRSLGLTDPEPAVRRAAVEALGDRPPLLALRPLIGLAATSAATDSHLRHAARIALRNLLRDENAWTTVRPSTPTEPDLGVPNREHDLPDPQGSLSPGDQAVLAEVSLGLPTPRSASFLLDYLVSTRSSHSIPREAMFRHVTRYARDNYQPALVALIRIGKLGGDDPARLLKAIAQGAQERDQPLAAEVQTCGAELAKSLLAATDPQVAGKGVDLIEALTLTALTPQLATITGDKARDASVRVTTLTAWSQLDPAGSVAGLAGRLGDSNEAAEVRTAAAKVLGASSRAEARVALIAAMNQVPAALQTTVAAALAATRDGAEALLDAVAAGKASPRPLGERSVVVKLEASEVPDLKTRLDALLKDTVPADQRILALIDARRLDYGQSHGGDAGRGQAVFAKNCAACHQIDGQGARVGPQLDGIGIRGLDRLLEDVLDPNRNVDQAFRTTSLALADGRTLSGLLLRQDGDVLILADAEGKEQRIPTATVEDRRVAQLSPMPANWGDAIDPTEFRHLMTFLLSKRPAGLDGGK